MQQFRQSFKAAPDGMDRTFAVCLRPSDDHVFNDNAWDCLGRQLASWQLQYTQSTAMPVTCMMIIRRPEAYYAVITYRAGKLLANVQRQMIHGASGVMSSAGVPVEGFAVLSQWISLRWVRVFNRHLQRSLGLGDVYTGRLEGLAAEELQKCVPSLLDADMDVVAELQQCVPALLDATPALADCAHDWACCDIRQENLFDWKSRECLDARMQLSGAGLLFKRLSEAVDALIHSFMVGAPKKVPPCGLCATTEQSRVKCNICEGIRCTSCVVSVDAAKHNQVVAAGLRDEIAETLVQLCMRWTIHQSQPAAVFYVSERVKPLEQRVEWMRFELGGDGGWVDSDLPRLAALVLRFMGKFVAPQHQKTLALQIWSKICEEPEICEGRIRPFALQQDFARVWNADATLCMTCGRGVIGGQPCTNRSCGRPTHVRQCTQCGSQDFEERDAGNGCNTFIRCRACKKLCVGIAMPSSTSRASVPHFDFVENGRAQNRTRASH